MKSQTIATFISALLIEVKLQQSYTNVATHIAHETTEFGTVTLYIIWNSYYFSARRGTMLLLMWCEITITHFMDSVQNMHNVTAVSQTKHSCWFPEECMEQPCGN